MPTSLASLSLDDLRGLLASPQASATITALSAEIRALAVNDLPRALAISHELVGSAAAGSIERLRALTARAHVRGYATEFEPALDDLHEAARIADGLELPEEQGNVRLVMIQPLARLGRLDQAEHAAMEAARFLDASGNATQGAKARVNLGVVLRMRGRAGDALAAFDAALATLAGDPSACAMIHSNRAEAMLNLDRFDDARAAFENAHAYFVSAGATHAAAMVEGNLADLLSRLGRVDDAIVRFESAQAQYEAAGAHADVGRLVAEEAEALAGVGAFGRCIPLYARAAAHLESSGMAREAARARLGLGLALLRTGSLADARENVELAISLSASAGDRPLEGECLIVLAELDAERSDFDAAREKARRALTLLDGRPQRCAVALITLAWIEISAGQPSAAEPLLVRADAALAEDPVTPIRVRLLHLLGRVQLGANRASAAAELLGQAVGLAERFRGAIRGDQSRSAYLESSQRLYHDLVYAALEASPQSAGASMPVVFGTLERMMSRSLIDTLGGQGQCSPQRGPLGLGATAGSALQHELNALYASLGPTARAAATTAQVQRLRQLEEAREHAEIRAGARTAGPAYAPILTLDGLCEALPAGHAFATLFTDGAYLSAMVVTGAGPRLRRRIIERTQASTLARRFEFALSQAIAAHSPERERRVVDALGAIGERVLAPVLELAKDAARLTWVATADLRHVPLLAAATIMPGPAIVHACAPSATTACALRRLALDASPSAGVLVVGVGDRAAPRAEEEASAVAATHPGSLAMIGPAAGADAVLDAASKSSLIHIACHGVFDAEYPMSSRLRVFDRWITARELLGAVRPGATIVLAGCSTARAAGHGSESEDRRGLVQALLASGAGSVVASLWPLEDDGACVLMPRFHGNLARMEARRPGSASESLVRTMKSMYSDGYPAHVWAALNVTGAL